MAQDISCVKAVYVSNLPLIYASTNLQHLTLHCEDWGRVTWQHALESKFASKKETKREICSLSHPVTLPLACIEHFMDKTTWEGA